MDSYASSDVSIDPPAESRHYTIGEGLPSKFPVRLEPAKHVRRDHGNWYASHPSGWLRLHFRKGVPVGRWISLSYRCSFLDRLVRPVMRFVSTEGSIDHSMAAALFGQATWVGRIPAGTTSVLISPVDRAGPFSFEITEYSVASRLGLLAKSFASARMNTAMAVGARIIGAKQELEQMIRFAMGGVEFENYHEIRTERLRSFDPQGIDRPRINWTHGPEVRLVVSAKSGHDPRLRRLLQALERQPYPRWSLRVMLQERRRADLPLPLDLLRFLRRGRLSFVSPDETAARLTADLRSSDVIAAFDLDDRLNDYTVAVVAERAAANPRKLVLYGDEDRIGGDGRYAAPCLKPDWSPLFERRRPYVGADFFMRPSFLKQRRLSVRDLVEGRHRSMLQGVRADRIGHIRRVLVTRPLRAVSSEHPGSALETKPARPARRSRPEIVAPRSPTRAVRLVRTEKPIATIIIPTKDQSHLLSACIEGLRERTALGQFEAIIVDNGSQEPQTFQLYERLKADPRFSILQRPGPFNFSNLCNEAARHARAGILVFMNNDIAMVEDRWLDPLVDLAARPEIGAVGAKLLFPSGKLQHAGVIVGMGGFADHIHRNDEPSSPGYLERLSVPHELSAVTGACVAVEARKFWAIGGFDGENLPVELNDIDLCLRLNEKGWKTVFTPDSVLIHHQSASRGFSVKPFKRYHKERMYFRSRWANLLRDDPYFNPALSLFSVKPMLG